MSSAAAIGVTREDQDRINAFSSKTIQLAFVQEKTAYFKRLLDGAKDSLEEMELCPFLLDEDEDQLPCRHGDIFIESSVKAARGLCEKDIQTAAGKLDVLEEQSSALKTELAALKAQLYTKFGNSIQLELERD